jgi:putative ATP-dependent endonuclease of OLD family
MVRPLTEHDFHGSSPDAAARIRVLVTLTGFSSNDERDHQDWFRMDRAVPKWIDAKDVEHASQTSDAELAVTLGFAARFDSDDLEVETIRYFHDDDAVTDPFIEDGGVHLVPQRLANEIGYFVLPARRTWDAVASFNSDLFRRTVSNSAGIPAKAVLTQRDQLRSPAEPIEEAAELSSLTTALNEQLRRLVLGAPKFQLRVTAGDSESVLQALLPHYANDGGPSLPAHRHGTGLLSLQTLLLLLEVGRSRSAKGESFVLALEEPELHLAPGVESRLVAEALRIADQVICTTHSPEVARLFEPTSTMVVSNVRHVVTANALLASPLTAAAQMWERRFYGQWRGRVVSALMYPFVMVPEGRLDTDWLARIASMGDRENLGSPPLACVYGFAPTEDAKVTETVERLRALRPSIVALVDGDHEGDRYAAELVALARRPDAILQWPKGWAVEDVVHWIMLGADGGLLQKLQAEIPHVSFANLEQLRDLLRSPRSRNSPGLKDDHVSHEAIVALLDQDQAARKRAAEVCDALVAIALGTAALCGRLTVSGGAAGQPPRYTFVP